MNIRGTDPAALAAATDLFAIAAPARDDSANAFRQALQPPRSEQSFKASVEANPSAPRKDRGADVSEKQQAPPSQPTRANDEQPPASDASDSPDDVEVVEQDADETEPVIVEEAADEVVAAESLAAAASQFAVCCTETPLQNNTGDESEVTIVVAAESTELVTAAPEVNKVQLSVQSNEASAPAVQVAGEFATKLPELPDAAVLVAEPEAESPEPIAADVVAIEPAEATGAVGGSPISVVAATATSAEVGSTRPSTRGSRSTQDRAEFNQQASTAADGADSEAPPVAAPTEIPLESPLVNEEATLDKGESKRSQSEVAATLPPFTHANDAEPTATMANEPALSSAPASHAPDPPSTASTTRETPAIQATHSNVTAAIINRLSAQALIRPTQSAAQENAPLHVDAARFLQRVTKAFDSARERGGEIRLRLSPPELGALRVEVHMHDQGLVARLEVETTEARAVLLENLPALRERLAEQGLRLEKFDVELSQREPQQHGGHLPDQPRERQSPSESRPTKTIAPRPSTTNNSPTIPSPASGLPDRQLNVIV